MTPPPSASGPRTVTVLLVDPHEAMRRALVSTLAAQPGITVIASVGGLDDALRILERRRPQVTLIDPGTLGDTGLAGLAALRSPRNPTAIVVIGVVANPELDHEAVRQGAFARILKDVPAHDLAEVVRAAARSRRRLRVVPRDA